MQRPTFADTVSATEIARTYWLKPERIGVCRAPGVAPTESKQEFAAWIVATLSGAEATPATRRRIRGDVSAIARAMRTRAIAVFARDHCGEASAIRVISIVFKSEVGVAGFNASLSQPTNYAVSEFDEAPSGRAPPRQHQLSLTHCRLPLCSRSRLMPQPDRARLRLRTRQ